MESSIIKHTYLLVSIGIIVSELWSTVKKSWIDQLTKTLSGLFHWQTRLFLMNMEDIAMGDRKKHVRIKKWDVRMWALDWFHDTDLIDALWQNANVRLCISRCFSTWFDFWLSYSVPYISSFSSHLHPLIVEDVLNITTWFIFPCSSSFDMSNLFFNIDGEECLNDIPSTSLSHSLSFLLENQHLVRILRSPMSLSHVVRGVFILDQFLDTPSRLPHFL